jgi:hypothetical protein
MQAPSRWSVPVPSQSGHALEIAQWRMFLAGKSVFPSPEHALA